MTPYAAYNQAYRARKRMPELEPIIMLGTADAYRYAKEIIKGRWPEVESDIMQYAQWSYWYAHDVIKGRWLEAEPVIIQDVVYAYWYAKDVIKERWYEAEPIIMQNAQWAFYYARNIIKNRWYEIEELVAQSEYKEKYIQTFFGYEPVVTQDAVNIFRWQRNNLQGYFAPASLFEDKVSFLDMMVKE